MSATRRSLCLLRVSGLAGYLSAESIPSLPGKRKRLYHKGKHRAGVDPQVEHPELPVCLLLLTDFALHNNRNNFGGEKRNQSNKLANLGPPLQVEAPESYCSAWRF